MSYHCRLRSEWKISHQRELKNKSEPSMATWAALLYSVAVFKTPVRVRTGVTTLDRHSDHVASGLETVAYFSAFLCC